MPEREGANCPRYTIVTMRLFGVSSGCFITVGLYNHPRAQFVGLDSLMLSNSQININKDGILTPRRSLPTIIGGMYIVDAKELTQSDGLHFHCFSDLTAALHVDLFLNQHGSQSDIKEMRFWKMSSILCIALHLMDKPCFIAKFIVSIGFK